MFSIIKYITSQYPWYFGNTVIDVGCGDTKQSWDYLDCVKNKNESQNYSAYLVDSSQEVLSSTEDFIGVAFGNSMCPGTLDIKTYAWNIENSGLASLFNTLEIPTHNKFFGPTIICTEVVEHLDFSKDGSVEDFVTALVQFGGPIIFSCAYPHQPGDGHIFCQYPSFWVEHFYKQGYAALDFRPEIWGLLKRDPDIPFWRIQNTLLFVPGWTLAIFSEQFQSPEIAKGAPNLAVSPDEFDAYDVIHPIFLEAGVEHGWFTSN